MAIDTLRAIGFCAHYSKQGDWAFDFALKLAQKNSLTLNVFHFFEDPYNPNDHSAEGWSAEQRAKMAIERERELRMYYDKRAGDYLDVGFRLCDDKEWTELHRCLIIREFQVLVLGYLSQTCTFSNKPIEEFADNFICPVVLVGPNSPDEFHLNKPAALIARKLGLKQGSWVKIESVTT